MKASPEIEQSRHVNIDFEVKRVKEGKVYAIVKNKEEWPELNEKVIADLGNPRITEHMGKKYVQLDTESRETIFLPKEKWDEVEKWAKQQNGGGRIEP